MSPKLKQRQRIENPPPICGWCGRSVDPFNAVFDYLVPLNKGGSQADSNRFISCERCARRADGDWQLKYKFPAYRELQ